MEKLLSILKDKNLTIGSVESMTGGLFASEFTNVPGASKAFKGSIISYAVEIKEKLLGIDEEIINKYSVVSKEVAYEMAKRGKKLLNVDVCVSITGNAGPTCEPGGEPVGACYIGVVYKDEVKVIKCLLNGNRQKIRNSAVLAMQENVLKLIG